MKNSIDNSFWMERATIIAKKNLSKTLPIASVLVKKNFEIGIGVNFKGKTKLNNNHAEINAMQQGLFYSSNTQLPKCTMYTTLEPCKNCENLIYAIKIKKVIFGTYQNYKGGIKKTPSHSIINANGTIYTSQKDIKKYFLKKRRQFNNKAYYY